MRRKRSDEIINRSLSSRANRRDVIRRGAVAGAGAAALAASGTRLVGAQGTPASTPSAGGATAMPGGNTPMGPQVDGLVFWTRASPEDAGRPNTFTQLRARADAYTAAVGTPIEIVTVPDADFRPRMSTAAPGGEGPDAFGPVAHDWIGEFALQQIALEMPDGAIESIEDFLPVTLALSSVDGPLYAAPLFAESVALIYNRDLVETPPATWDELVTMSQALTSGEVYGFGFPLLEQYHEGGFFMGFGSYIFKYENGVFNTEDIGLNTPEGVEAAKFIRDMYHMQMPPMPDVVIDRANMHGVIEGMMESGQVAMTINGPWRENPLTAAGINYGVSVLPTLPNGEPMRPFIGVQGMLVSAFSENQEAALDFVNFMTGTDSSVALFASEQKVPARASALQSETVAADETIPAWAAQIQLGQPMPNIAAMGQVWTPWGAAMDAIVPPNASDEEVQQYLDDAVVQIQTAIERTQG
ncbi:MAG: maltose ABC transporter substrate-binding protein [Chloroflexia bacterium]|nr:maltose ABC transporter substrate-binding protein [Chloroflexia bacterium]